MKTEESILAEKVKEQNQDGWSKERLVNLIERLHLRLLAETDCAETWHLWKDEFPREHALWYEVLIIDVRDCFSDFKKEDPTDKLQAFNEKYIKDAHEIVSKLNSGKAKGQAIKELQEIHEMGKETTI